MLVVRGSGLGIDEAGESSLIYRHDQYQEDDTSARDDSLHLEHGGRWERMTGEEE